MVLLKARSKFHSWCGTSRDADETYCYIAHQRLIDSLGSPVNEPPTELR